MHMISFTFFQAREYISAKEVNGFTDNNYICISINVLHAYVWKFNDIAHLHVIVACGSVKYIHVCHFFLYFHIHFLSLVENKIFYCSSFIQVNRGKQIEDNHWKVVHDHCQVSSCNRIIIQFSHYFTFSQCLLTFGLVSSKKDL